jgi:hypothetical protein
MVNRRARRSGDGNSDESWWKWGGVPPPSFFRGLRARRTYHLGHRSKRAWVVSLITALGLVVLLGVCVGAIAWVVGR